jgi:hypothetical protein
VIARYKRSSLLGLVISNEGKKFYKIDTRLVILLGSGSGSNPAPFPARRMNGDIMADCGLAPIRPAPGWNGLGRPSRLDETLLSLLLTMLLVLLLGVCILTRGFACGLDFPGLDAC